MLALRPYQVDALKALDQFWNAGGGHPLLSLATATGKSLIIARLLADIAARYPALRALVLVHVRELLDQNRDHLIRIWPDAPIGMNSAGLGLRSWDAPIVLASIQSVWRSPHLLGRRDLVVIDEAHLVPQSGDGMYRTLLASLREPEPAMRVCGLTATPYRLDSGRLDQGEGRIFDELIYEYGIGDGVQDGWLAPLSSKATETTIDVSGVARRGGEFVAGALEDAADIAAVVNGAADEIVERGHDRRAWLVFCAGVRHAAHVQEALCERGVSAATIISETPGIERDRLIAEFRQGNIKALVNVNVLTTGFNVPGIDLVAMLRPTLSTGLYVQMVGRGTRKAEGKENCLVLDFAGNVYRHGPVDCVDIKCKASNGHGRDGCCQPPPAQIPACAARGVGSVAAKKCPECGEFNILRPSECSGCGYELLRPDAQREPKHASQADTSPVLGSETPWLPVTNIALRRYVKYGDPTAPPCLRVEYLCGLSTYSEYVSLEREGYTREMGERWWCAMGGHAPAPSSVADAIGRAADEFDTIVAIRVTRNDKFWNVIERRVRRADGSLVSVNRYGRCSIDQHPAQPQQSLSDLLNDEVPY